MSFITLRPFKKKTSFKKRVTDGKGVNYREELEFVIKLAKLIKK